MSSISRCAACTESLEPVRADLVYLEEPELTVLDVPLLACERCGRRQLSPGVADRLRVIVRRAFDQCPTSLGPRLEWRFTWHGPPELGGLPVEVRKSFELMSRLVTLERQVTQAAEAARDATPHVFH